MNQAVSDTVHASAIAIGGHGVLLCGPTGSGKSDLALRLIDRGATLISDDRTELHTKDGSIVLRPPENIAGKIEVFALGVISMEFASDVPLCLKVQLGKSPERFPMDRQLESVADITVPRVSLSAFEHSAPIKLELALEKVLKQESRS